MPLQFTHTVPVDAPERSLFYGRLTGDRLRIACAACGEPVKLRHLGVDPSSSRCEVACDTCNTAGIYEVA